MAAQQGDARPGLTRQGSVARTNAIAMLKRAASQREMKAKADTPVLPGAFPATPTPPPAMTSYLPDTSTSIPAINGSSLTPALPPSGTAESAHDPNTSGNAAIYGHNTYSQSNGSSDLLTAHANGHHDHALYPDSNAKASTSSLAPTQNTMLAAPSSNDSNELLSTRARSPMFQDRANQRPFNRSPLPSLEQLRARILLERETEGLQRSASTSAASQAARAYALEKLLGNSGTDVFYDHTPEGTLIGRGAATPSPTPMSGRDEELADIASDDETAHETRIKRQSIKNRPMLRRSRTVNGLTAMAEAQNKADFVQGVFLAVPGPASNRISRIHQRRVERQSMLKMSSATPSEVSVPEETIQEPVSPLAAIAEAPPSLSRQQSQRQIARTEMMRKLSTRGRANSSATAQPAAESSRDVNAEAIQLPRLPKVITDSPAVDETISPVGVVIRPPSSPVPPYIPHYDNLATQATIPGFRQALSPGSVTGNDAQAYVTATQDDDQYLTSSPGLKASSSAASLASRYAHSTATNATARHNYERNRESAMALLNNEDSFGFEASPSLPSHSIDVASLRGASVAAHSSRNGDGDTSVRHDQDPDATLQASTSHDGYASDNDGLNLDFGDTRRKRRRAGLVGLGLDAVPSDAALESQAQEPSRDTDVHTVRREDTNSLSPGRAAIADSNKRKSKFRQSLAQLKVQSASQDLLSSPSSYTDEEALEDDAFYKLYSPVTGDFDDEDEDEDGDEDDEDEEPYKPTSDHNAAAKDDVHNPPTSQSIKEGRPDSEAAQGLGFLPTGVAATVDSPSQSVQLPTTPPQRVFHRGTAAVPCDPSPSTETDFGDARRTPYVNMSPGGFNLPLRLSNSLMSTAHAVQTDSPATDPSPVLRGPSRKTRGDWPMSVASSGTLPPSRESLEGRSDAEARLRSSEDGGMLTGAPAIGSPLLEVPEDEPASEAEHGSRHAMTKGVNASTDSEFELLSVPGSLAKPSERLQAMLGSSFVAEYGADLDLDSRSRSSVGGDEDHNLKVPNAGGAQIPSVSNMSNISINEISDVDGEVDDAYLQKVDRMADKLGKLARTNKVPNVVGNSMNGSRAVVEAPTPARKVSTGSRFVEHTNGSSHGHSQRPSTDLSALVGNEKLHPFPGLAQASPVQSQDGWTHMAVSSASNLGDRSQPASTLASSAVTVGTSAYSKGQSGVTASPPSATVQKDDQENNGKQIGLFSSLRRKASSLRRTPSSAKEGGGFWNRKNRKEDSPKVPTEATFISAPILTETTPGPAPMPTQPIVTVDKPQGASSKSTIVRPSRENDATFEHRLFDSQSTDSRAAAADLQRNASISSVVSARIRPDLQDGTADADASTLSDQTSIATSSLAPNTAAMIHRYSRMLSTAGPTQSVPGASEEDMQDPPRKLLATDPVFQVISSTTIKDRYLFLFSDILVIAKPIAAPGAEAGQALGKMKQAAVLPSLSWKFAVKNIIELHRLKVSVTTNTRTASAKTRAQNPVLWGFVSHFSKDRMQQYGPSSQRLVWSPPLHPLLNCSTKHPSSTVMTSHSTLVTPQEGTSSKRTSRSTDMWASRSNQHCEACSWICASRRTSMHSRHCSSTLLKVGHSIMRR